MNNETLSEGEQEESMGRQGVLEQTEAGTGQKIVIRKPPRVYTE